MNQDQPLFWEVLQTRRSIRKFTDKPVSRETIERLLQAAVLAPNAHNRQSWRFVALSKAEDIRRLAEEMGVDYRAALQAGGMNVKEVEARAEGRKARICGAQVVIVVCVDPADLDRYADPNRDDGEYLMGVQSAALGGGYLLLAAHAEGLGGTWMCAPLFAPERVREACDLPQTWIPQGMVLLGYPAEEPKKKERKPLEEVVRFV